MQFAFALRVRSPYRQAMLRLFAVVFSFLAFPIAARATEPTDLLRAWSSVKEINLRDLAKGKIATSTNASMNLDRGMSCQAVFVVNAPMEVTHQALLKFNATRHPELEVFQHHVFQGEKDDIPMDYHIVLVVVQ